MRIISIGEERLTGGARIEQTGEKGETTLLLPAAGGGLRMDELIGAKERYVVFSLEALTTHSVNLQFLLYSKEAKEGPQAFDIRFGIMPGVKALLCFDLHWLDAHILFPETTPGEMKVVCHGGRVPPEETDRIVFESCPCYEDVRLIISDIALTDEKPADFPLPDLKLIDKFGQYKKKEWPEKITDEPMLKERLNAALRLPDDFTLSGWDEYGGWAEKKLREGTGFFTKAKVDGRWWLVDPLGNAFFSMGPDCVVARSDCRVDSMEKFMDWLPDRDDPVYGSMYETQEWPVQRDESFRTCTLFSFEQANLYRAFGEDWYEKWQQLMVRQLKSGGLNTLANWSDRNLLGKVALPYVAMLPHFPTTAQTIFRDFPDVLSEEYAANAVTSAEYLRAFREDSRLIGYFLRNEPSWAFVDGLVIADEVLYNPAPSACKEELINTLREKYGTPEALSAAWNRSFGSFDDLRKSIAVASRLSARAGEDMREFSRRMLRAYVEIPSKACRAVDPNHMNLGMRWAWISDPDLVTGWENFDVFSINCYAVDPTSALDNVVSLGVDLPIVIGEFHFGALDGGVTATGLEGVLTQEERGQAYRYYCERVAAHPCGVGCHWFQCYDQFELGRFDGENYNIGLFDICSQPSQAMMKAIRACGEVVYQVAEGSQPPVERKPKSIPMIAY
ncbi:MAG: hypothetical protein ACK5LX_03340 [Oscillospiraceae bacterium]